tara:strand:- start:6179 stop:7012 length:834 start_codon:yes stop_codon:yes gene_type:complete
MSEEAPVEETAVEEAPAPVVESAPVETTPDDWKQSLSEEVRDHASLKKYTSVENLAKGYINASSMLGKDKLVKPSSDDEWNDFYNDMGRPESHEGYKFTYAAEVPEGLQGYVEGRVESFKESAHKLGLTSQQADGLYTWYMEGNVNNAKQLEEQAVELEQQAEYELKKEWGPAYEEKITQSQAALSQFASPEFVDYLEKTQLGNNPHMIRAFAKIAEGMMEDGQIMGVESTQPTVAQIDNDISAVMANPAYWDADSLERPKLVAKVHELIQLKEASE